MRSEYLIILIFFFFSVSSQAGSHGIHSTFIGDSNSTDKFTQIKMLSQEQSSSSTTNVYANNSPTSLPSSSESVNHVTDGVSSHDAFEHESVIFLAQGISGFITF